MRITPPQQALKYPQKYPGKTSFSSARCSTLVRTRIGFRYENPILIRKKDCEPLSRYSLGVEEIA
jgi:hypothetical protein